MKPNAFTEAVAAALSAAELLADFGRLPGPPLDERPTAWQRRRYNPDRPRIHKSARTARRKLCRYLAARGRDDAAPHNAVGVTKVWSANAPPAVASA